MVKQIKSLKDDSFLAVRKFVWQLVLISSTAYLVAEKVQKYQGQKGIAIASAFIVVAMGMFCGNKA